MEMDKCRKKIYKLPGILEKIVAAILLIGVAYSCIQLIIHVFAFNTLPFNTYIEDIMVTAFNGVIVIEFIRMLVKHSMNTIIEVLIFAIARGLVVGHESALETLASIACSAILMACRKYLFKDFDFEEEE